MVFYQRPLKLAYFSPLPPQPSGISDYSQELLPHLAAVADPHLFIDDYEPSDHTIKWRYPLRNYREFAWRQAEEGFDAAVYQMGNSRVHRYIYRQVFKYPGVVVLHDLVLHHMIAGLALESERAGIYLREMAYSHGSDGVRLAWEILNGERPAPFFEYPLCQRVIDASLGVLVHSEYLAGQVRKRSPDAPVGVVPMGIPAPPDPGPPMTLRARLGLPANAFLIASLGEVTAHKRIGVVLQALARLVGAGVDAHYVVVGNVAGDLDLGLQAQRIGIASRLHVTGYVPQEEFNAYLHAADLCVNLRYPTAGETSASALRCLAAGRATVVSDIGANRELPDGVCIKVPVNGDELDMLTAALQLLARRHDLREQVGAAARRYIQRNHRMEQAAAAYVTFIDDLVRAPRRPHAPKPVAREYSGHPLLSTMAQELHNLGFGPQDIPYLQGLGAALAPLSEDRNHDELPAQARWA